MLKCALTLALLVIAAEAKTRRGVMPLSVWEKLRHLPEIDEKIVGGQEVEPNSIPHQISYQYSDGFHACGGSIYDADTIITAAHCCKGIPNGAQIVAGDHNLFDNTGDEQNRKIASKIVHESYSGSTFKNDICLLKLAEPLDLNDKVQAVDLPKQGQQFSGSAIVSGWGRLSSGGSSPDTLQSVEVPLVSDESCDNSYGSIDPPTMICAGEEGKDSCQGDSGGPMMCTDDDGKLVHCGIVSWGRGCALAGYPGVYAETSHFIEWIAENA